MIPFDPKEMRADAYVYNFEQAIRSYYKSECVTDYIKRQHFFEALSGQQRLAIGCMRIGGTYEEKKQSFLAAYGKRQYDTLVKMIQVRMREGETAAAFANRFRGMLPTSIKADNQLAKFLFLNRLPSKLRTREAIQIFEDGSTFKDLMKECQSEYQQALSDRSNKCSRAQVNTVQDDDEEVE